jgi:hypothetical protein
VRLVRLLSCTRPTRAVSPAAVDVEEEVEVSSVASERVS